MNVAKTVLTNKRRLHAKLYELAKAPEDGLKKKLDEIVTPEIEWRASHPFNETKGAENVAERFWQPLKRAFPNLERRDGLLAGGIYREREFVAALGHYVGNFSSSWLGIPPHGGIVFLRYGEVYELRNGRIGQCHCLIDVLDFIRQAGHWPVAPSIGYEGTWPGPLSGNGIDFADYDPASSQTSLEQTLAMHGTLADFDDEKELGRENLIDMPQKEHWHEKMMWYGPAGIGTSRGLAGFVDVHQLPFRRAFPNRKAGNHYVRIGDNDHSVTGGWPSVVGRHLGGDFMGLPPTGKKIEMRVMDFYFHHEGKIRENWVPLDILHVLLQMGTDVLGRLLYRLKHVSGADENR